MREFINIITEASSRRRKLPAIASIDTAGYKTKIASLLSNFTSICHIRFNQDWITKAKADLMVIRDRQMADHQRDVERHGEEDSPFGFDEQDYLPEIINRLWSRNPFFSVRSSVEHEYHEYQQRAAERHGYEDNLDNYIESSDYLSGMEAMAQCAASLTVIRDISNPTEADSIFQILERFLTIWDQHEVPGDDGEAPILDEDFVSGIQMLLPLLFMRYSM